MRIQVAKSFKKDFKKAPRAIQQKAYERILLFAHDSSDTLLNDHPLGAEWVGYRSINVTGDWRAVYEPVGDNLAYFIRLGTHHELYGT